MLVLPGLLLDLRLLLLWPLRKLHLCGLLGSCTQLLPHEKTSLIALARRAKSFRPLASRTAVTLMITIVSTNAFPVKRLWQTERETCSSLHLFKLLYFLE